MSEAIRMLSRQQRHTFDSLYLDGPTPLATLPAGKLIIITRLIEKDLAFVVDLPRKGAVAFALFAPRPGARLAASERVAKALTLKWSQ